MVRSLRRRTRLLARLVYAAAAAIVIALCVLSFRTKRANWPVDQAKDRSSPEMPVEETVASEVLRTAADADSVQFLRWGPHDLTGELVNHRKGTDDRIIRVRYRCRRQGEWVTEDNLYYLLHDEVNQVVRNLWGDDWRTAIRRLNEGKPAIETPPAGL